MMLLGFFYEHALSLFFQTNFPFLIKKQIKLTLTSLGDQVLTPMKIFLPKMRLLFVWIVFLVSSATFAQRPGQPVRHPAANTAGQPKSLQQQGILLCKALQKHHYSPRKLDDQLSKQIFTQFIELLDPHHLYFTAADIKTITPLVAQIDNELVGAGWKFLPQITGLYKERLLVAEKTFGEILQKPFDFSTREVIHFADAKDDSLYFAADEKQYRQLCNKWLKYQTLLQLTDLPASTTPAQVTQKEPTMRLKVQRLEKRNIRRVLEHPLGYDNYVGTLFFQAITSCFDPHTNYMSKAEWENYEASISTETPSLGIDLEENEKGDVEIARLVPGGPAWKSNELHKGDVLTGLQWKGKPAVDLDGADSDEIESLLSSSNDTQLELTVRKVGGQTKTVSLAKEKLREDENIVKSFILKGDKKIGYISLPGFYGEWENESGQGCANDVAKEIVKLKKENIDGLILDIRYNGGGALAEGIELAGIFINEGPLFVLQERDKKPTVVKDMNRGTVYDGPLVVMVNGLSASASEVFASTVQDYNRALIVGSPTFGKATGQMVMPLDSFVLAPKPRATQSATSDGYAAITMLKLYRVTGQSAQLKGVQPHIYLPDIYETLAYRESLFPFVLPHDSTTRKVYYTPLKALPVETLSQKSATRIATHTSFQLICQLSDARRKTSLKEISLNFASLKEMDAKEEQQWLDLQKASERKTDLFTVEVPRFNQDVMRMDTYGKEVNELIINGLQSDIYIAETYRIMQDLIGK